MFKSVTFPVRQAVVQSLEGNIVYMGATIPVSEEYANKKQVTIPVGINSPVSAWIRVLNQTEDDDSPKCLKNTQGSIQIQVQVSFNANSGNSEHSENIMNLIIGRLFPTFSTWSISLSPPFHLWDFRLTSFPNVPPIIDNTNRIWVKQALIEYQVSQSES